VSTQTDGFRGVVKVCGVKKRHCDGGFESIAGELTDVRSFKVSFGEADFTTRNLG
jgi:hypothetical protein